MNVTILERFDLFKETFNVFGTFILKKKVMKRLNIWFLKNLLHM